MYVSLYMFTGEWTGETREDGTYVIRTQAYFRNELPPGHFPYPFWHSATKWDAYEKSNQISLYLSADGKVKMVTRHSGGSDSARPAAYKHVEPPVFAGQWNWTDTSGQAQPQVTLFSDLYSASNPHLRSWTSATAPSRSTCATPTASPATCRTGTSSCGS
jgi:hypothetical protein